MNALATFEIHDNVPLPPLPINTVYPFGKMSPGQSFDAPRDMGLTETKVDRRVRSLRVAATAYARKHGGKFTVRVIDAQIVRCWRLK